jgi:hypothetical protein
VVKAKFESNAIIKEEQARLIEAYCTEHNFWFQNLPAENRYYTRDDVSKVHPADVQFILSV